MTTEWLLLGLVIVLLGASAYFVAAEFALIAARRTIIEPLAVNSARARTTLKAMENVSEMMACAQLGITLCGVLLGALGEPAVAALLEPVFHSLGVPEGWLHPVSLVIALLLVVSAHVALGEMVPKNIAIAGPEQVALALAPSLLAIGKAIGPIIRTLNHFAKDLGIPLDVAEPKSPRGLGDHANISGWGSKNQIRIRPSLWDGSHPQVRSGEEYAEGRFLIVAVVLLHETIHQYHDEITGQAEKSYHGHGPAFRDE